MITTVASGAAPISAGTVCRAISTKRRTRAGHRHWTRAGVAPPPLVEAASLQLRLRMRSLPLSTATPSWTGAVNYTGINSRLHWPGQLWWGRRDAGVLNEPVAVISADVARSGHNAGTTGTTTALAQRRGSLFDLSAKVDGNRQVIYYHHSFLRWHRAGLMSRVGADHKCRLPFSSKLIWLIPAGDSEHRSDSGYDRDLSGWSAAAGSSRWTVPAGPKRAGFQANVKLIIKRRTIALRAPGYPARLRGVAQCPADTADGPAYRLMQS